MAKNTVKQVPIPVIVTKGKDDEGKDVLIVKLK